jgi:uncharacterized protein YcbX
MERPKGAFCYYQGALFGAPSPLKVEGRELKAQLARRRENENAWLFESVNQNLRTTSQHTARRTRAWPAYPSLFTRSIFRRVMDAGSSQALTNKEGDARELPHPHKLVLSGRPPR